MNDAAATRIHYHMEEEKIIYFYPEQTDRGNQAAAKGLWFQKAALNVNRLDEEVGIDTRRDAAGGTGGFSVIGCAIPPFYCIDNCFGIGRVCSFFCRRRSWKPQMLAEAMDNVMRRVEGMADTYLHPQIEAMLTEEYCGRFSPTERTIQMLAGRLMGQYAADTIRQSGEVTVLLGEPKDTDLQMKMTRELLLPYLPRINRLLIFYEEVAETDIWMELANHLDEYYYEYGLVPQLEPYGMSHAGATQRAEPETDEAALSGNAEVAAVKTERLKEMESAQDRAATAERSMADTLRCGRTKCGGVVLDYAAGFRYPKIRPDAGGIYIDITSESKKETLLRRKTPQIPYVSPLKYLDTMVKSSYYSMT